MTNLIHTIGDLQFSNRRWSQIQHGMQILNELEY